MAHLYIIESSCMVFQQMLCYADWNNITANYAYGDLITGFDSGYYGGSVMCSHYLEETPITRLLIAFIMALFLLGCASKPPADNPDAPAAWAEENDPLEPFNRSMYQLDQGLDTVLVRPLVITYRVIPKPARRAISNVIRNARSPITLANDILQGEGTRAGITVARLIINSTLGIAGMFDVASEFGLPYHYEDFGQTLAAWGVNEGPFLYAPILGPLSGRDVVGLTVDSLTFDPTAWYGWADNPRWHQAVYFGVMVIDTRGNNWDALEELRKSSIDYYATLRSAYRQTRDKEIRNGAPQPIEDLPIFEENEDPFSSIKPAPPVTVTTAINE